jgi:hypothetical protein
VDAAGAAIDVSQEAFIGCTALSNASFGRIKMGLAVFACCPRLSVLNVRQVDDYDPLALCGSSVSLVRGSCRQLVCSKLFKAVTPLSIGAFTVTWNNISRDPIVPMTVLTVVGGPCRIAASHRHMLVEVDLGSLDQLPVGISFALCLFLKARAFASRFAEYS